MPFTDWSGGGTTGAEAGAGYLLRWWRFFFFLAFAIGADNISTIAINSNAKGTILSTCAPFTPSYVGRVVKAIPIPRGYDVAMSPSRAFVNWPELSLCALVSLSFREGYSLLKNSPLLLPVLDSGSKMPVRASRAGLCSHQRAWNEFFNRLATSWQSANRTTLLIRVRHKVHCMGLGCCL